MSQLTLQEYKAINGFSKFTGKSVKEAESLTGIKSLQNMSQNINPQFLMNSFHGKKNQITYSGLWKKAIMPHKSRITYNTVQL